MRTYPYPLIRPHFMWGSHSVHHNCELHDLSCPKSNPALQTCMFWRMLRKETRPLVHVWRPNTSAYTQGTLPVGAHAAFLYENHSVKCIQFIQLDRTKPFLNLFDPKIIKHLSNLAPSVPLKLFMWVVHLSHAAAIILIQLSPGSSAQFTEGWHGMIAKNGKLPL